jgi:phosphatidylglycerol---prolipoprotein diacylglyceryl transferase
MDPVAFAIGPLFGHGPLEIRWYGIMMALSMLLGAWIASKLLARLGYNGELVWDGLFYVIIAGIAGARLAYVLTNIPDFFGPGASPWEVFAVWHGGLSFHGGIICGGLAVYFFFKKYKIPFLVVADAFSPGVGLGVMLVRVGNFMNGDILGYKWDGPWAMNFPHDQLHIGNPGAIILRHPTELYGLLVGVIVLLVTAITWYEINESKRYPAGMNLIALIISYSLARSIIEDPFRDVPLLKVVDPATAGYGLFTYSQLASIVLIIIAAAFIPYLYKLRNTREGTGTSRQVRRAQKRTKE